MAEVTDLRGIARFFGHMPRGFRWMLVASLLLLAALEGAPLEQSRAFPGGGQAVKPNAQVRILRDGRFAGGGTLVARNWVLTSNHLFEPGHTYALRFGVTNDEADGSDDSNYREIDQIIPHRDADAPHREADLALVHFVEPVPQGTWIPDLSAGSVEDFDWSHVFGWGESNW